MTAPAKEVSASTIESVAMTIFRVCDLSPFLNLSVKVPAFLGVPESVCLVEFHLRPETEVERE